MTLRPRLHRPDDTLQTAPLAPGPVVPPGRAGPPARGARTDEPSGPVILGFPAETEDDGGDDGKDDGGGDRADDRGDRDVVLLPGGAVRLVVTRRADPVAGVVFVLAGAAASVSLWLRWDTVDGASAAALARQGLEAPGIDALVAGEHWPPVAVVVSGAAFLLVALLLFRRARTHRAAGVLALLAAAPAVAGVLVSYADLGWDADRFGPGLWCAVATAGLGTVGALKAMLTLPRVTAHDAG